MWFDEALTAYSSEFGDQGLYIAMALCICSFIPGAILQCVLLYRFWFVIQDGKARTTPARAIGYLFIPLFNIYWFFVAFWGLAVDLNKYVQNHSIQTERVSEEIALAACILSIFGKMPGVVGALIVAGFIAMLQMKNCVISILEHQDRASIRVN